MSSEVAAITNPLAFARDRMMAYYELNKPRVLTMVLITTLAGFYMGSAGAFEVADALKVLAGTALAAGGTLALNQYFERDTDAMMMRTRDRPLPSRRLTPIEGLLFGLLTSVAGLVYLWHAVNPLSATVTSAITLLYLAAYTPMKRYSWMCHVVGAVPGALPPLIGWAAARDSLSPEPWILFGIMFLWQLPHSLSIARIYQDDYTRAGMSLLPRERPYGNPANLLMLTATVALVAFGTLPTWMGFAGRIYLVTAVILGALMLYHAMKLVRGTVTEAGARRVMLLSLIYLPAVLLVMVLDKV